MKSKVGNHSFPIFFSPTGRCSEVLGSSNLLHLTKRRVSLCDAMVFSIKSLSALNSYEAKQKKGWDGHKTKKRTHAHSKNTICFVFYCIQMRVHKRAKPARVGGLADWLRTDLTDSRSPPPLITMVTAVCILQAGVVLSVGSRWRETRL